MESTIGDQRDIKGYEQSSTCTPWTDMSSVNSANLNYFYDHYWQPMYTPVYLKESAEKNKFEQAFKVVSKLLEKKIIEEITVGKFIELVNEIVTIL